MLIETISPERKKSNIRNGPFLLRALAYFLKPFYSRLKNKYFEFKYKKNSDDRKLDFKWDHIPYNRIALVNILLKGIIRPSYLEIGCASNDLFNSIPVESKIGVDPLSGGTHRLTSDTFFEGNNELFDVVFIDGLHTYQQVRKDVQNAIKNIKQQGGWIALHDMLPRNWIEQHIPIITDGTWTGDVWKIAFELSETSGIEFKILTIDNGVGVIKIKDRNVVIKNFQAKLENAKFTYFYDNLEKLPLTDWNDAQEWLNS